MIEENSQGLAIYGSIVGTIALGINIFNYLHTKQKDTVRLTVECHEDENAQKNVDQLFNSANKPDYDRSNLERIYNVIVRNIGNIEAHIQEVGVIDENGITHSALIQKQMFLVPIAQVPQISIKSKAMEKFFIYLKRDEPVFRPVSCFVTDQQQKTWKKKTHLSLLQTPATP